MSFSDKVFEIITNEVEVILAGVENDADMLGFHQGPITSICVNRAVSEVRKYAAEQRKHIDEDKVARLAMGVVVDNLYHAYLNQNASQAKTKNKK